MTNTGTEGSLTIAHNGVLASGKSGVKISSNAAQSTGDAILYVLTTSSSSNIPALLISDAGSSGSALKVVSTTKPSHPAPTMTTTQRNALAGLSAGDQIFNSTNSRLEVYDGTNWVDSGGRTGEQVDYLGASIPAYLLACDGSAVSRTTYAALFAKLSTTWGVGDGSTTFNLPDLRGRACIGDGTGSGLTARTLADSGGGENLQSHTHSISFNTGTDGTHGHSITDPGHSHTENGYNANGALGHANVGGTLGGSSTTASATTGIGVTATGSAHAHAVNGDTASSGSGSAQNMMPFKVVKKCVVI